MLLDDTKREGTVSSPVDCAKNSNTDQEIEIIEVINNITKEKLEVKILRDPSKYLNPNLNSLTNEDIYAEKKDSKGVPFLNKIEKYPNLPNDVFIPTEYIKHKINYSKYVFVNKNGEYIKIPSKKYLNLKLDKGYKNLSISINSKKYVVRSHIPEAHTFLYIPQDKKIFIVLLTILIMIKKIIKSII